jgi:hypothetical protein
VLDNNSALDARRQELRDRFLRAMVEGCLEANGGVPGMPLDEAVDLAIELIHAGRAFIECDGNPFHEDARFRLRVRECDA